MEQNLQFDQGLEDGFLLFPVLVWAIMAHSKVKIDHSTLIMGIPSLIYQQAYKTMFIMEN